MSNHNLLRVMRPRHLRRAVLRSLIVSICASVAFAQQPRAIVDAPSTERLRAHITYLASDKLEGRRTGSSGANLAAEYIAREFARYGLRQAHSPRRYLQTFPYVASVELGKGNVFSVRLKNGKQLALRVGEDWMPLALSSTARLEGVEGAFVNYGITATELSHNDYGGLTAKGRVALALSGTPDGDNPHGQFARYEDVRWKAIAARNAGAKALIIVAREDNFKDDRLSRLRYDNTAGDAGLPVLAISRQAASALLQLNNLAALTDLEKSISRFSLTKLAPPPGWSPERESWLIPSVEGQSALTINLVRREVSATNVVGILPGSDPKLKDEAIVIGAHYDHLGHGGAGSLAPREGEIHHGADDNASGVAGMLELARLFSSQQPRPRRTIVFIAFSGEEEGLLGSNYYVNHPVVPLANTVAMINMDMIGRLKNNNLVVGGVGTASELRSMIEAGNQMQGLRITPTAAAVGTTTAEPGVTGVRVQAGAPLVVSANGRTIVSSDPGKNFALTLNEDGFGPSDHSSFYAKQVPVLFFWTGTHDDYHKPSDTAEKINYDGEARIVSFVARIAQDIDRNDKRPGYTVAKSQSTGRGTGFRVYLGTIPNYADSNDGLKLDGVRDDSPAATSGLKAGDRIVKLAGREIKNVYDYTYALGEMKAGQEYEVEVVRGSERLSLRITPSARK